MDTSPQHHTVEADAHLFRERFEILRSEIHKFLIGQEEIVDFTLIAMIAGGHVLLEGVPGLGKTALVRTISQALHLNFQRIQFTPDLMPTDLIGTKILVEEQGGHPSFEFSPGPIFCNLLLGDEINRATPKTQSALLEAMQEKSVTIAGETRPLARPFFVLATQNPLEMEGTYPLPEAQLDRFFFNLKVPYPGEDDFTRILAATTEKETSSIDQVFGAKELLEMERFARSIPIADDLRREVVRLVMSTHPETDYACETVRQYVQYGASPRAGQACILAAKIQALLNERLHVSLEDILTVAPPVLRHRIILNFEAQADGKTSDSIISQLIEERRTARRKQS
ncbi:AAA family ATPase [Puniceicoccus vermicola]|uniref:MoxR family ATPase n=1 Tax=Puniceicoccus vermicola TaxID=388746 RepID=A0A7X1AZJ9_9BACT|nr:MoxR family ATPase [Puniceicoccus vermicola]MBC2602832.1 MoxR family ATPase [Puniceicoccus vermicola]